MVLPNDVVIYPSLYVSDALDDCGPLDGCRYYVKLVGDDVVLRSPTSEVGEEFQAIPSQPMVIELDGKATTEPYIVDALELEGRWTAEIWDADDYSRDDLLLSCAAP